jgi:hypothetical protein
MNLTYEQTQSFRALWQLLLKLSNKQIVMTFQITPSPKASKPERIHHVTWFDDTLDPWV